MPLPHSANSPKRTPPAPVADCPTDQKPVSRPAIQGFAAPNTLATDTFALQAHLDQLSDEVGILQSQLRQAQKMAGIGTTAAMIAHEFNNLFTPVVAYAQQALDTSDVDLMRQALQKTLDRTTTMREMSDRVIGLARPSDPTIKPIRVLEIVQNAIGCLGRDLEKDKITVNLQIDSELSVRANENQLLQVLFNLLINARQAMKGHRGRLTVDAAPNPEDFVEINVRDTGCGIKPDDLYRIFEPFFSTKQHQKEPDAKGLGLGLPISRDIIEDLDGRLDVTSRVDKGTTFTITLPQAM